MNRAVKLALPATALLAIILLPAKPNIENAKNENQKVEIEQPILEARSALALDLISDEIYFEKNIHEPLPLASLSKIVSSLVVADHVDLNEYIEITKSAVQTPEPSSLEVGEHLRVEDLLAMAMGESSNDAMMALVEYFGNKEWSAASNVEWFLELMREKAKEFRAETMTFLNPTGLDIDPYPPTEVGVLPLRKGEKFSENPIPPYEGGRVGVRGQEAASNFGSAYDLAQIVKNTLDSIIWQVGEKEEVVSREGIVHKIRHTNLLRNEISGIAGAKTGFTDSAGGNLILIIEKPLGMPKLIIIFGSTLEGRFEDAKKLLIF